MEQIPLVNSLKNISTSSVPHSFTTTVCKSMWSLTNTQIRGPATPVPGQWGKYTANPKDKVWLACFISTFDFWFHCQQSNFHFRNFSLDQFFNMNATFLTLGKPVQFPVSYSLQTWQKQNNVCSLYMTTKTTSIADEICYLMFCQNKQKHEMLPPMTDFLLHHLKQSNCKAFGWNRALEAMEDLGSLEGHG